MIHFYENKKRLDELREFIRSTNQSPVKFYKEPEKDSELDLYNITLERDYSNPHSREYIDLEWKWYFEDRRGVLRKVKYGGYGEVNDKRWFISHECYNELVKLGLKVEYPLTDNDALRFLEGICNGSVYKEKEDCFSDELKEIMEKKFRAWWDSPDYVNNLENHFIISKYALDEALNIVKKRFREN